MKVKACRLCFAVEVRVFNLRSTGARQFIMDILKANGFTLELRDCHYICYECQALLEKSYNFVNRVLIAQGILNNILKEKKLSVSSFKEIDRHNAGIATGYTIHVLKNIDISGADYNDEYHVKNEDTNDVPSVKKEKFVEFNSSIEDLMSIDKEALDSIGLTEEHKYDDPLDEYSSTDNITTMNYKDDVNPTYSSKKRKGMKKTKKKNQSAKPKLQKDVEVKTKKDHRFYSRQRKESLLKPSKFMLSAINVGDRSERRKNKQYKFEENDETVTSEDEHLTGKLFNKKTEHKEDQEFTLESEYTESSESDCSLYEDNGKIIRKHGERVYPRMCDHCDYEVPAKKDHYKHYQFNHSNTPYPYSLKKTFVCQFCGYLSRNSVIHRNHELSHSGAKDFACLQCPKKFPNGLRLSKHVYNIHTTKFYECDYCGKQIKVRSDLVLHLRIHTGEKPFNCYICGARFAHKGNVGIHIRANHGYVFDREPKTAKPKLKKKYSKNNSLRLDSKKKMKKRKLERKDSSDDNLNLLQLKRN